MPDETRAAVCPRCGAAIDAAAAYPPPVAPPPPDGWPARPVELLVDNVRSLYNVGSFLRTADAAGVRHVYLCGITATPDHPRLAKTALGAERSVAWSYAADAVRLAASLAAGGRALWALETAPGARSLFEIPPPDRPCVLIVGNEQVGVDPALLALCERVVYIPMVGKKESLNVATAFGVAAYALVRP